MEALFLTISIFFLVFVLIMLVVMLINKDMLAVKTRLDALLNQNKESVSNKKDKKSKDKTRIIYKKSKFNFKPINYLSDQLYSAGIIMKASEFIIFWVICSIFPFIIAYILRRDLLVAGAVFIIFSSIPIIFLYFKKSKRLQLFEKQLSEALIIMGNCLKVGLSFQQCLESIAREMPEPISKEFSRVFREMQVGLTLEKALTNMSNRMNSKDFSLLVSAILVNRQVGGNLSELLTTIAGTIKERLKIKADIKVLTATGRTSGLIIGMLPIIIAIILSLINPNYMRLFLETSLGINLLIASAVLEVIGFLFVRKIVNIKY